MNLVFYQLAIGAEFEFRGERLRKTARSFAEPIAGGNGCVMMGEAEVISDGPLLPPDVAAKWKPDRDGWRKALPRSPVASWSDDEIEQYLTNKAKQEGHRKPSQQSNEAIS